MILISHYYTHGFLIGTVRQINLESELRYQGTVPIQNCTVPHFFCIILPEICTTKIVLKVSRRYYDDLYQRIDRYHIGGKSTIMHQYRYQVAVR